MRSNNFHAEGINFHAKGINFPNLKNITIMAVKYRLVQNNRSGSKTEGKWYARASYDTEDIIDTKGLADKIAYATTVTDVDAEAVIKALCRFMREALIEGTRVKLNEFGTFKCGLKTAPAESAKEFNANTNVKSVHVLFQPYAAKDKTSGKYTKSLISGIRVVEKGTYFVDKKDEQPEP